MKLNIIERFKTTWTNILFLPDNPVDIGLDAATWILSVSTLTGLLPLIPVIALPLFAWFVGVLFALFYIPTVRAVAIYRLVLIVLGLFILI